jgi:ribosomal protein L7Ae-like RNA K-turn-binding protein
MNNQEKIRGLLGIAQRARQLVTGEDLVIKALRNQQIKFVFLSNDAGSAIAKKMQDQCHFYHVPIYTGFSKAELSQAIGQTRTVIGVTQSGFAKRFTQLTNNQK